MRAAIGGIILLLLLRQREDRRSHCLINVFDAQSSHWGRRPRNECLRSLHRILLLERSLRVAALVGEQSAYLMSRVGCTIPQSRVPCLGHALSQSEDERVVEGVAMLLTEADMALYAHSTDVSNADKALDSPRDRLRFGRVCAWAAGWCDAQVARLTTTDAAIRPESP